MSMFKNPRQELIVEKDKEVSADGVYVARRRQSLDFTGEKSRTKQEFLESSDLNNIMKRYPERGTVLQHTKKPMFGDFAELPTFQEALNVVVKAREGFEALPSHVRERFHNSPEEFLAFVHGEGNEAELKKLGLIVDPPKKAATLDDVVDTLKASDVERSVTKPLSESPKGS